jgi:hypothetical protein
MVVTLQNSVKAIVLTALITPSVNALDVLNEPVRHHLLDSIFTMVSGCFPATSKYNIKLDFIARAGTSGVNELYDDNGTLNNSINNRYYAGIQLRVPLYSSMEIERSVNWEREQRQLAADAVGVLGQHLAAREQGLEEFRLFKALEQRSQQRVLEGVAETAEQVGYLEKAVTTRDKITAAEAGITTARLKLTALCSEDMRANVNQFIIEQTGHYDDALNQ